MNRQLVLEWVYQIIISCLRFIHSFCLHISGLSRVGSVYASKCIYLKPNYTQFDTRYWICNWIGNRQLNRQIKLESAAYILCVCTCIVCQQYELSMRYSVSICRLIISNQVPCFKAETESATGNWIDKRILNRQTGHRQLYRQPKLSRQPATESATE